MAVRVNTNASVVENKQEKRTQWQGSARLHVFRHSVVPLVPLVCRDEVHVTVLVPGDGNIDRDTRPEAERVDDGGESRRVRRLRVLHVKQLLDKNACTNTGGITLARENSASLTVIKTAPS